MKLYLFLFSLHSGERGIRKNSAILRLIKLISGFYYFLCELFEIVHSILRLPLSLGFEFFIGYSFSVCASSYDNDDVMMKVTIGITVCKR